MANKTYSAAFVPSLVAVALLGATSGCSTGYDPVMEGPCCAKTVDEPADVEYTAVQERFDPVIQKIEGWTVHVDPKLLEGEHAAEGAQSLKMLANHLQRIAILVPADRLADLQKCEIWIQHRHHELGNMQYHPSERWITGQGYDPRLAKKVHIPRASRLNSRGLMSVQPAVILHELAHAYHDQFLSFDNPKIIETFQSAMDQGLYDKVMYIDGRDVRHYATTNHKEYFAEATEAYFYRNDFYPFVRGELKNHDPQAYRLMQDIWGK